MGSTFPLKNFLKKFNPEGVIQKFPKHKNPSLLFSRSLLIPLVAAV
jgi:hypothetical protein